MKNPGNTPLICIDGLFAKLECTNPTGSIKDRMAKYIIDRSEELGLLKPGMTIVEDTSGSSGISFGYFGRLKGYHIVIVMPEHMSDERKQIIRDLGAELILTSREGGFAEARRVKDNLVTNEGYFSPEQFSNPLNVECHAQTTGPELIRQLQEKNIHVIDAFVASVGTGGTLIGVGQTLREICPEVKIVVVEPAESAVMTGGKPGQHGIQGIGIGIITPIASGKIQPLHESITEVQIVSTEAAKVTAKMIAEKFGFCVGVSSGANFLAAQRIKTKYQLNTVVTVFPDGYLKYQSHGLEHCGQGRCPYESEPAYKELIKK